MGDVLHNGPPSRFEGGGLRTESWSSTGSRIGQARWVCAPKAIGEKKKSRLLWLASRLQVQIGCDGSYVQRKKNRVDTSDGPKRSVQSLGPG